MFGGSLSPEVSLPTKQSLPAGADFFLKTYAKNIAKNLGANTKLLSEEFNPNRLATNPELVAILKQHFDDQKMQQDQGYVKPSKLLGLASSIGRTKWAQDFALKMATKHGSNIMGALEAQGANIKQFQAELPKQLQNSGVYSGNIKRISNVLTAPPKTSSLAAPTAPPKISSLGSPSSGFKMPTKIPSTSNFSFKTSKFKL